MNIRQVTPDEVIQYPDGTLAEVYNKGRINEYIRQKKDGFEPLQQVTREDKPIIVFKDKDKHIVLNQKSDIKRQKSRKQTRAR